jgi:hypothetical protein
MGKKVIYDSKNEINDKRFHSIQFSLKTDLYNRITNEPNETVGTPINLQ